MIQQLRNLYHGATAAVLGSGPTLDEYLEKEDLAIAVNGAAFSKKKYHIFLAGDINSPRRSWWQACENNKKNITRILSSYISVFDKNMYPCRDRREMLQGMLKNHIKIHEGEKFPYAFYSPNIRPKHPHSFFRFGGFGNIERVSPGQKVMYWGGTISSIAVQLSLIMGCKRINIYGCGFDNEDGANYHYSCPEEQRGSTTEEQRIIMQRTIDIARDYGIEINIAGKSKLK